MTTTHFDQLQLAERWGLSPKTLERWRVRVIRTEPQCIRLPGKVIYRLCDIKTDENPGVIDYRVLQAHQTVRTAIGRRAMLTAVMAMIQ